MLRTCFIRPTTRKLLDSIINLNDQPHLLHPSRTTFFRSMGGKAFKDLGEDAFPRIPPDVYRQLKDSLFKKLSSVFEYVGTPEEAPEKTSHGDVDFIVSNPQGDTSGENVTRLLEAQYSIPAEGNRTSNFALKSKEDGKFHQVDVHVCKDKDEWDRIMFFHSYGDLGMMLGMLARLNGLRLGVNGMKIVAPQEAEFLPPSFELSDSFPKILDFFGLSMDVWKAGFSTRHAVFEWVASSRLYDPRRIKDPSDNAREKPLRDREMYQAYLDYSRNLAHSKSFDANRSLKEPSETVREAIRFFNKEDEYNSIVSANRKRISLKKAFSGRHVMEWTGVTGISVRDIMSRVRSIVSEDDMIGMDEATLRSITLQAKDDLGITT